MKILILVLALLLQISSTAQIPAYYNNVNLNATGQTLKNNLANKVVHSQTNTISYTPGVWNALKQTDLDPTNTANVILIYGYSNTDGNSTTDRTRSKYSNGGGSTDWNREHVYPKSLGTPNLGSSGPGADPHHIRSADVNRNASRGSRKFASGSGNSKITAQGFWYPGDEFKGDVARMIMYMYLRYGSRCLPKNVGIGSTVSNDPNMLQLFLQWNVDDPVSTLELQRNGIIENLQGNRNPFIDNPAFATQIWGGQQAEDRFGNGGGTSPTTIDVNLRLTFDNYPEETSWEITNSSNQVVYSGGNYGNQADGSTINIAKTLSSGCYYLTIRDSYGDGMCCSYGNGSFLFTNTSTGNTITSGGSFQTADTKAFCLGGGAARNNSNTLRETREAELVNDEGATLAIYPNPVHEVLYMKLGTQAATFELLNQVGQIVDRGTVINQRVPVEGLAKGLYWIRIQIGEEKIVKKFIKA
ncbi:endonuclease [Aureispira anguillae]|uniref:Endonuclease n=1 Tax=Aureispira anguillae TaxID=2864201 RepID=A0A915YB33_9BACT|nr:endonuclease [Aureispira anguillae]BDS09817.1 endonuclease [Aureispira anguillae]